MEFKEVNEMPTNFKELTGEKKELHDMLKALAVDKVVEVTPEEGKNAKQKMHTVKAVARRIKANFKFRTIGDKIYVQKLSDGEEKKTE